MASPSIDESVARLVADPAALVAEVARYTALKAEAESKMRAVVDEASAHELLENVTKRLAEADNTLHRAELDAQETRNAARLEAEGILERAENDARDSRTAAEEYANATRAAAAAELQKANARAESISQLQADAERAIASARASRTSADEVFALYKKSNEEVQVLLGRLKAARDQVISALGG